MLRCVCSGCRQVIALCGRAESGCGNSRAACSGFHRWGKFWLAMCGLYGWDGVNPFRRAVCHAKWLPFSPFRYHNHTRYIYMGIAYLYGKRFQDQPGRPARRAA